jgi:hypothetical protein
MIRKSWYGGLRGCGSRKIRLWIARRPLDSGSLETAWSTRLWGVSLAKASFDGSLEVRVIIFISPHGWS